MQNVNSHSLIISIPQCQSCTLIKANESNSLIPRGIYISYEIFHMQLI